jgi:cyanophycinase
MDDRSAEVRRGLGILPGVILDQHFVQRQRQNRLFGLVLAHPDLLGVGVDEGTALAVRDNRHAEVLGASKVTVVDAQARGDLLLHLLQPGDSFDLLERRRP